MNELERLLLSYSEQPICILDSTISIDKYIPLDLSKDNKELVDVDITNHITCQSYIVKVLQKENGQIAYGGYLEKRNLYSDKVGFTPLNKPKRNIHLGTDFWCKAGTKVIVPLDGKVHSFNNNSSIGDYGPTIVLEHSFNNITFYTLYGHLTLDAISGLVKGKSFSAGDTLAKLGTPDINVNYAPHLHFQIIKDLEGNEGDYPGVCAKKDLSFYKTNCPDPDFLLKVTQAVKFR